MKRVPRKQKTGGNRAAAKPQRPEALLRLLIDAVPAMISYVDTQQRYLYCNRPYREAFGLQDEQVLGRSAREVLGEKLYEAVQPHIAQVLSGGTVRFERRHRWPDGSSADLSGNIVPHVGEDGAVLGVVAVLVDITELKRAEEALRESELKLRTIANNLPALVGYIDVNEIYHFANSTYQEWLGLRNEEVVGRSMREVLGPKAYAIVGPYIQMALSGRTATHERELIRNGERHYLQNVYVPHFGAQGEVIGFFVLATDVSDRKVLEAHLSRIAQHDSLTGLPNRALFEDRLRQAIERSKRSKQPVAVMYVDIDLFKKINDTLGHVAGDELLQAFSARISQCVRAADTVARLGGDEFIVLLEEIARTEDAVMIAEKIINSMQQVYTLQGVSVSVTASIGIALGYGGEIGHDALIAKADAALYQAKADGRNAFRVASQNK
jgi:diguanylate cyclase (GGDEF)-like protein/PAS domain S-box-containing protein